MENSIKTRLTFNSKFVIIIINFAVFALLLGVMTNIHLDKNIIMTIILLFFIVNSLLLLFFINWVLNRFGFNEFYLKNDIIGVDVLNFISKELNISIQNIEGNIFYTSYNQKIILGNTRIKDVFFIIEGKRIFLNIQNRDDSIFIYNEDITTKKIKKILTDSSQRMIVKNY
ncbi:hypothetical protein [Chishuiella sp.]|uniref:hypothetical protein n=1 Tax=Chishuiella sp. TaxID=1969467 RepID=UPI0028A65316|nr:hypothetical protein [Chishuiella sp.]